MSVETPQQAWDRALTEAANILKRERVRMIEPNKRPEDRWVTLDAVEDEYRLIQEEILALKCEDKQAESA